MALTPVEIRHVSFGRTLFGYRRSSVERVRADIVESFEDVWRDRADLGDKVEHLEQELVRYRELEDILRATLVSAERAAHELRDHARREADVIVQEAHAEARSVTRAAAGDRERLLADARRIRVQLRAALEALDEQGNGARERRSEAA